MPSTFSPNKGYELMATGEDTNVWGDKTNANLQLIDANLGSIANITITGNRTLTDSECNNLGLAISGSSSTRPTITFPATGGYFVVFNNLPYTDILLARTGGSATVSVAPAQTLSVINNDGGIFLAETTIPPGAIFPFAGSSVPSTGGYVICAGQTLSRTFFARLFAAIGTTWGAGNGSTTFNVPDLRGRALFGLDNMGGTSANRITSGGSGINGTTLGATGGAQNVTLVSGNIPAISTGAESSGHTHSVPLQTFPLGVPTGGVAVYAPFAGTSVPVQTNGVSNTHYHTLGNGSPSAVNKMPPTAMINYIIKV
jgi:microcystin-dependent protein